MFQNDIADCTITVGRYQIPDATYLDAAEAKTEKKTIEDFSVRLYQHFSETDTSRTLNVDIDRFGASVYLSDDTDNYLLGLASKLDGIFRAKKSLGKILSNPKVGGTLIGFLLCIFFILFATLPWKFSDHSMQSTTLMIVTFIPLLMACVEIAFVLPRLIKGNVIYLEYSHNRTNFLKRNKDQIIFALTFGIIGVVLGAILTAIILHAIYPPKP